MLRRLKDQVEKLMPKKIETKVLCPLSSTQVFWYKALLMKDIGVLANTGDAVGANKGKVLNNLIMQLRKCCLHPFLFPGAEANPDETSLEDLIASSGKLAVLDKLLRSLYQKEHRTILFSQFASVLDILEDYCALRGWSYCRFDGSTARATRNYVVSSFNEPESDKFIFLMSTRSGGMGLNLQTADTCILYDSDWNPQPDLQAMARVHRIGQTKTVHVYRLITNGTIEERIEEQAEKKLFMDRMVNSTGGDIDDKHFDQVAAKDVVSTLHFG
jgi:SWI/SNF-related matrix-associated actin-dependent regulator of chromatin subfamily A member 5